MIYPFVLGTAQFGTHYGITNSYGCPSDEDVQDLLEYSLSKEINFLDTASAYGNSIERILNFYSDRKNVQLNLINKFSAKDNFDRTYEDLLKILEKAELEKFYGLLIHDPANLRHSNEKQLLSFLQKVKQENIAEKVGVSIYAPQDLTTILDVYPIDLIQCPLNFFDQRLLNSDMFDKFKQRNIEIHARSLFLQGVLLSPELPPTLNALRPVWKVYNHALLETGLSPLRFIMSWVKSLKGVDKWVIGINRKEELAEIVQAYDESRKDLDYNWSIFNAPHELNIDPRNWAIK